MKSWTSSCQLPTHGSQSLTRQIRVWQLEKVGEKVGESRGKFLLFVANSLPTCLSTVFVPFTHINTSLPTPVCQLKFVVWTPLKGFYNRRYLPCIPTSDSVGVHRILSSTNHIRYNPNSCPLISVLLYSSKQNTEGKKKDTTIRSRLSRILSYSLDKMLIHHRLINPFPHLS